MRRFYMELKTLHSKLLNDKGIALAMVLVLSVIALAIMASLVYMLTASTQVSGIQKRYATSLDAGKGGAAFTFKFIDVRGNALDLSNSIPSGLWSTITVGSTCLNDKLNKSTLSWATVCSRSITIDPDNPASYDMVVQLGTTTTYRVYSKIVDTVAGNTGADTGLIKSGVVSANSGEVTAVAFPALHTIEVQAENTANRQEKGKYSILYQY